MHERIVNGKVVRFDNYHSERVAKSQRHAEVLAKLNEEWEDVRPVSEPPKAVRITRGKRRKTRSRISPPNYRLTDSKRVKVSATGIEMGKSHVMPQAEAYDKAYTEQRRLREFEGYGPARIPMSNLTPDQARPIVGAGAHARIHEGKAK
jgi:hypothetical protein